RLRGEHRRVTARQRAVHAGQALRIGVHAGCGYLRGAVRRPPEGVDHVADGEHHRVVRRLTVGEHEAALGTASILCGRDAHQQLDTEGGVDLLTHEAADVAPVDPPHELAGEM